MWQVKGQMTLLKRGGKVRKALLAVQQTESEVEHLQRAAAALRQNLGQGRSQGSWRAFESVTQVLVDAGDLPLLTPLFTISGFLCTSLLQRESL